MRSLFTDPHFLAALLSEEQLYGWSAENKIEDTVALVSGNKQRALLVTEKWVLEADASFQGCVMACCGQ